MKNDTILNDIILNSLSKHDHSTYSGVSHC